MFSEETNPVSDPGTNPAEPMAPETPASPDMPAEAPAETPNEETPAA